MWRLMLERWRILAAASFALVFVVGAYMIARGIPLPSFGAPTAYASTQSALLETLATKDSDHDGLPDWEEALYGTDPHNPDTFHLGMTDGEAVARGLIVPIASAGGSAATSTVSTSNTLTAFEPKSGTLTAAFAHNFLTLYAQAEQANGGTSVSASQTSSILGQALSSLDVAPAPDFESASQLVVSGSGELALESFASEADAVFKRNANTATTSELTYLKEVMNTGSSLASAQLTAIAKTYKNDAMGLSVLPVPKELAAADLALVNAMMRLSGIIDDFTRANTDPLVTIIAIERYAQAATSLKTALAKVGTVYVSTGVATSTARTSPFLNLVTSVVEPANN